MKAIYRNFLYVIQRFASSSLINFLGLMGAITVFLVCLIQLRYDYGYNRNIPQAKQIQKAYYTSSQFEGISENFNTSLVRELAESTPLVTAYTTLAQLDKLPFWVGKQLMETSVSWVSPGFIDVFEPEVLHGDARLGIAEGGHLLITASEAQRLFGREDVVGEMLRPKFTSSFLSESVYTIEAVIADYPDNCTLQNGLYAYQPEFEDSEVSFKAFFLAPQSNTKAGLRELHKQLSFEQLINKQSPEEEQADSVLHFISFQDFPQAAHFNNLRPELLSYLMVGFLVLFVAYFNFINFSLTMAPTRVRSLNIHRVLGLSKAKQRGILITESLLFTFFAFLGSLVLVSALGQSDLSTLFKADLSLTNNCSVLVSSALGLLLISLLIGIYPARYATSFQETEALKGGGLSSVRSKRAREVLLLFQLCVACVLPIVTAFIYAQNYYMFHYSWGIEKEQIVYFQQAPTNQDFSTLITKLQDNPAVTDYTSSRFVPGQVHMGWGRNWKGQQVSLVAWPVYPNFLDFFGVPVVEGENFPATEDGTARLIFNESFVKKYGGEESLIGEEFPGFDENLLVCGVAQDINFESLHQAIRPMAFITLDYQNKAIIYLKLAAGAPLTELIPWIETVINEQSDIPVSVHFLDQELDHLYLKESNQAQLIGLFSLIILVITLMGVYGLVSFNVKFREKEIALRKVSGASAWQIVLLLNRRLLCLFGIAYALAVPIAYTLAQRWLSQFAYRISLSAWLFVGVGLLVLLITLLTVSVLSYRAASKNPIAALKPE